MEEGAKLVRNITLAGAFWVGFAALVFSANAQTNIYGSDRGVQEVKTSSGMNPGTVPQAEVNVEGSDTGIRGSNEAGNANTGGTQVQSVTVQANPNAEAEASATSTVNHYSSVDSIVKTRSDTEQTHNALLLQKLEIERLKSEQNRIHAIEGFSAAEQSPTPAPCGAGPCYAQPLIQNNNLNNSGEIVAVDADDGHKKVEHEREREHGGAVVVETEHEYTGSFLNDVKLGISPIVGMRWFSDKGRAGNKIENLYLVGVGLEGSFNPWVSAEANFIYGKDKITQYTYGCYNCYKTNFDRDTYEFAMGTKIGPTVGRFLRPYVSAGLGYLYQTYDVKTRGNFRGAQPETNSSNFEGNIGAGLDLRLSQNFSMGARAEYQKPFGSNREILDALYGDSSSRTRLSANAVWQF